MGYGLIFEIIYKICKIANIPIENSWYICFCECPLSWDLKRVIKDRKNQEVAQSCSGILCGIDL